MHGRALYSGYRTLYDYFTDPDVRRRVGYLYSYARENPDLSRLVLERAAATTASMRKSTGAAKKYIESNIPFGSQLLPYTPLPALHGLVTGFDETLQLIQDPTVVWDVLSDWYSKAMYLGNQFTQSGFYRQAAEYYNAYTMRSSAPSYGTSSRALEGATPAQFFGGFTHAGNGVRSVRKAAAPPVTSTSTALVPYARANTSGSKPLRTLPAASASAEKKGSGNLSEAMNGSLHAVSSASSVSGSSYGGRSTRSSVMGYTSGRLGYSRAYPNRTGKLSGSYLRVFENADFNRINWG